jgi:hypothetical protein
VGVVVEIILQGLKLPLHRYRAGIRRGKRGRAGGRDLLNAVAIASEPQDDAAGIASIVTSHNARSLARSVLPAA